MCGTQIVSLLGELGLVVRVELAVVLDTLLEVCELGLKTWLLQRCGTLVVVELALCDKIIERDARVLCDD